MPDISLCSGEGCNKKDTCYRFLAEPNKYRQSYFSAPPLVSKVCEYYMEYNDDTHRD